MRISRRAERIAPFYVMEVAKAAAQKARDVAHTDRPVVFLNIGEPDFTAPALVQHRAQAAIQAGQTQYTPALGLDALRQALSPSAQVQSGDFFDPGDLAVEEHRIGPRPRRIKAVGKVRNDQVPTGAPRAFLCGPEADSFKIAVRIGGRGARNLNSAQDRLPIRASFSGR